MGRRSSICWSWRGCWCRWRPRVPRSPCTWICPTRRRRAGRCCSSTRARVAARRSASRLPTRHARGDRADRAQARRRPRDARPGGRGARRRRARDGRRRRLAGDRRGDRRRARAALRVRPRRHAQPLRARPRRRPRRRRRRARRVCRRRRAHRRPGRGQRSRVRQQRLARALRRGRPARPATATRRYARCSTPCPTCSAPTAASSICAGPARAGTNTAPARWCSSPTTAIGSAAPSARAHGQGSTTACSGSLSSASPPDAARAADRCSGPGANGPHRRSRSTPTAPSPPASTARRSCSTRHCGFEIRPAVLRVRIARQHPGASPSATAPEGVRAGLVELARIAAGHDQKPAASTTRRPEWT